MFYKDHAVVALSKVLRELFPNADAVARVHFERSTLNEEFSAAAHRTVEGYVIALDTASKRLLGRELCAVYSTAAQALLEDALNKNPTADNEEIELQLCRDLLIREAWSQWRDASLTVNSNFAYGVVIKHIHAKAQKLLLEEAKK